jgi:hypothetical protein
MEYDRGRVCSTHGYEGKWLKRDVAPKREGSRIFWGPGSRWENNINADLRQRDSKGGWDSVGCLPNMAIRYSVQKSEALLAS